MVCLHFAHNQAGFGLIAISHHTTYSTKEQDQVIVLDKNTNNSIIEDGNLHQFRIFHAPPDDVPLERKLAREAFSASTASGAFAADDPELTVKLDQ